MIGVACFVLLATVVGVAPIATLWLLDRRDEKRRTERMRLWYEEHGGGE